MPTGNEHVPKRVMVYWWRDRWLVFNVVKSNSDLVI